MNDAALYAVSMSRREEKIMKRVGIALMCLAIGVDTGIAGPTADVARKICLPNAAVVGRSPDEAVGLIEKVPEQGAVLPVAVEVLIEDRRCMGISAKYSTSDVSFRDIAVLLTARHGAPLRGAEMTTVHWKLETVDGKKMEVCLHQQGSRISVSFRQDPDAQTTEINEAVKRLEK